MLTVKEAWIGLKKLRSSRNEWLKLTEGELDVEILKTRAGSREGKG